MWMPGLLALILCAAPQNDAPPAFEAASVKANLSGAGDSHSNTRTSNLQLTNMPLRSIITMAYQVKDYQVEGPTWLASERYDIVAKAASGTSEQQLFPMLQTLLAERFYLKAHRETKELQVEALVAAKSGFRLKPVEPGDSSRNTDHNAKGGVLTATRTNMDRLAVWLNRFTDRPVVNMTGIDGVFNFTLNYSLERENRKSEPNDADRYPIVPLAIQEQLGLRLEKRSAMVEVLVVDRVEKVPAEN